VPVSKGQHFPEKGRPVLLVLKCAFARPPLIANDASFQPNGTTPLLDCLSNASHKSEQVKQIANTRRERCIQKWNPVLPELKLSKPPRKTFLPACEAAGIATALEINDLAQSDRSFFII
jgi:hypothetical protein